MILDLHIHSKYSFDSILSPKRILETAKKRGLDGVAVTDHNTIRGGVEASEMNKENNFVVIIGSEISTEIGDIIGLFLKKEIKSKRSMKVIEEIKDQGGLVVLPHPFRGHKLNEELLKSVDVIEGFNARSKRHENLDAQKLAMEYGLPIVGGSDAHFVSEIGLGESIIYGKDVRKAILKGNGSVKGVQTPPYLHGVSQIIKSLKTRASSQIASTVWPSIQEITYGWGDTPLGKGLKKEKIRICFAVRWTKSLHLQAWIRYFINEKYDVHIITHSKENVEGAKTYHLLTRSKLNFISGPIQTRWLLRKIRPDILHADLLTPYGFYAALSRFHPIVISCRGTDVLINPQRSKIIAYMTKFVAKRADLIYSVGDHLTGRLIALGADEAKVTTITIGIDGDTFHPNADKEGEIRKNLGWIENPLVVSIRNFESLYNVELLIRAMPIIVKENNSVRFIVAGKGSQESYLKGLVGKLGMNEYVKFVGFIEHNELPKTLACADIYVSTSLSDGISVSLLEGVACGCFPVVTDIPGNRAWIQDGENGFLVPLDDPKVLADRIILALKNKKFMESARKKNMEKVKKQAVWEKNMKKVEERYKSLINRTNTAT